MEVDMTTKFHFPLYPVHVELTHTYYKNLNNFRQERDMGTRDLYHSTALVEAVKSLAPSNV